MGLKAEHERFCQEYIIDLNAVKSYQRVYADASYESARALSSKLLTNINIQDRISELREEAAKRSRITIDELLSEQKEIAMSNVKDFIGDDHAPLTMSNIPRHKARAIQSVKRTIQTSEHGINVVTEIKMHSKMQAIDNLNKHLGIYEKNNEQKKQDNTSPQMTAQEFIKAAKALGKTK